MAKYYYGQLTFFNGAQYLGYVDYVRPTRRAIRYAVDWANKSDKYNSWTTAVYWFKKQKHSVFHRTAFGWEINNFINTKDYD